MTTSHQTVEKVTFNIPTELKQEMVKLKSELKVSLNTLYKNAITEYIKKQGNHLINPTKLFLGLCKILK